MKKEFIYSISTYSTDGPRMLITSLLVLMTLMCSAQFTRDSVPKFDTITVEDDTDLDSTFFFVMNRYGVGKELIRNDTDSVLNYWNHIPAQRGDQFYYSLGNTGSPALNAYWTPDTELGFDPGVHHLDLYRLRSENLNYYSTDRAYTLLHYNQAPQQTKSATNVKFGRALDRRSGISLQYDRINDEGEFNQYKSRNTSVGVGLYYFPVRNKKLFFSFVSNNITLEENGGIESDTFLSNPIFSDPEAVPVNIANALSELKEREIRLNASWNLGKVKGKEVKGVSLMYDGHYNLFIYKYADADTQVNYYHQYLIHKNGQRAFVKNKRLSNAIGLSIGYGQSASSKFDGKLSFAIEHRLNQYTQSFSSRTITNLLLYAKFDQQLSDKINLHADAAVHIGDQAGDYLINGALNLSLSKDIVLTGFLRSQLNTPTGIQVQFSSIGEGLYNLNVTSTKYNSFGGRIELKRLGFKAEIKNTLASDHIYFNFNLEPERIGSTLNIFQAKISLHRKFGILHTENHIFFQNSSDNRIPLPSYFSKHYLGLQWKTFKKNLLVDSGVEGVILPDFHGYKYFSLLGKFYPDSINIPFNYSVNGIIGLRINQFKVYVKLENMHTIWDDTPRFTVRDYPFYNFRLRIGFRWMLRG